MAPIAAGVVLRPPPAGGVVALAERRPDAGERVLKPLRSFEHPLADGIGPMSYVELQSSGDGMFPTGRRQYWKGGVLRRLGPAAIDVLVHFAATCPSRHTPITLQQMHGAAARVPPAKTSFAHRHDQWDCVILSQWDGAADDEKDVRWTREFHAAMAPYLERAVYVNDLGADEADRVRAAYGANYERLLAIKGKYDSGNFFRGNQNVAV